MYLKYQILFMRLVDCNAEVPSSPKEVMVTNNLKVAGNFFNQTGNVCKLLLCDVYRAQWNTQPFSSIRKICIKSAIVGILLRRSNYIESSQKAYFHNFEHFIRKRLCKVPEKMIFYQSFYNYCCTKTFFNNFNQVPIIQISLLFSLVPLVHRPATPLVLHISVG